MSFHGQRIDSPDTSRTAPPQHSVAVYDARRLTDGAGTAMIVLDDKTYTLRITRAGKLILTK
ncbi:hemin uptake protein HemP [Roseicyclus persicicus]|uniref:Hemin uptake protein HemP n=1 Tax=Roseicyclus persicicus TaxID=2650661 RepID=A0A7X6GWE2_9RHOB|nr:hemin uptake protein HemP [Roseibacterium persicicum]NKX43548.1 hemin uptake protein HemP [Roseibacterium persicicum]